MRRFARELYKAQMAVTSSSASTASASATSATAAAAAAAAAPAPLPLKIILRSLSTISCTLCILLSLQCSSRMNHSLLLTCQCSRCRNLCSR